MTQPRPVDEAVAQAKANANAITAPDGTVLRDRLGMPVKTVRSATSAYVEAMVQCAVWHDNHAKGQHDQHQVNKNLVEWGDQSTRMLDALAHHDDVRPTVKAAELKPKVDKKIREWFNS